MPCQRILHLDSSARSGLSGTDRHGSHTRRLSHRFVDAWTRLHPGDSVTYRDVGQEPPAPVTGAWIAASFTPPDRRSDAMREVLRESDRLSGEVIEADLIVIGAPMYNFGVPAPLKAWIDNVVRVGVTFGFDRGRDGAPYWPMLPGGKRLVILTARGDHGYGPGGRLEAMNLVEAGLTVPFAYIGLIETHSIAIEYDEFADHRLATSIRSAEADVDRLAAALAAERSSRR